MVSHKINYIAQVEENLNLKGFVNGIIAFVQKLRQFCGFGQLDINVCLGEPPYCD